MGFRRGTNARAASTGSPGKVFLFVVLTVFVVEGAIMVALPLLPVWMGGDVTGGVVDATVLTVVTAPVVWWLAIFPLRKLFDERGAMMRRMFEAQEDERSRIARDLHDSIGQQLTAVLVGLKSIDSATSLDAARERARQVREIGAAAHDEVRRLARGLRPAVLEDLGLGAAMERLCADFQKSHGIPVKLECRMPSRLDPETENAVYRIVQEAMNNAAKHSAATSIRVRVVEQGRQAILEVEDNGKGFDVQGMEMTGSQAPTPGTRDLPPGLTSEDAILTGATGRGRMSGMGLRGMFERASLLKGNFAITSEVGKGTLVKVQLPISS